MAEFGNDLVFDYTNYSWVSIKVFLDCLHLIPAGPVDIGTLLEVVDFCQFEGKTTYNSFERELVEQIMASVMKASLPIDTELLISAYLSRVDNLNDQYHLELAKKLTEDYAYSLFFKFDIKNRLNKRLISMCIKKKVFADESKDSVLIWLLFYGKELIEFKSEKSTYTPDPRLARY